MAPSPRAPSSAGDVVFGGGREGYSGRATGKLLSRAAFRGQVDAAAMSYLVNRKQ